MAVGSLVAAGGVASAVAPGVLSIFAGTGTGGAPTPGPATSSKLVSPQGVAVDASGNVYIAGGNSLVEKVTPAGTLSVIAGTGTFGAPTPGPATSSNLGGIAGVAVDRSGNVYITDPGNNLIEKVTPAGTLSVIAGTGTRGAPTPGPATSSNLNGPVRVAVDASGNVYIADQGNNLVEKVGAAAAPAAHTSFVTRSAVAVAVAVAVVVAVAVGLGLGLARRRRRSSP